MKNDGMTDVKLSESQRIFDRYISTGVLPGTLPVTATFSLPSTTAGNLMSCLQRSVVLLNSPTPVFLGQLILSETG